MLCLDWPRTINSLLRKRYRLSLLVDRQRICCKCFLLWDLKPMITSYVSIQQRFRRQHNAGRPAIWSRCNPSLCTDACCGQPSCWYLEQSTGRPGIDIRRKWRWWRWGTNVSHNASWLRCSWRDRGGSGCWIWWDAFVAYATSNTESTYAASNTESSSTTKDEFTTASGRFAGVVLDVSTTDCLLCLLYVVYHC